MIHKFLLLLAIVISCLLLNPGKTHSQVPKEEEPGIGVVEHLGETLPPNISFINEKNEPVKLKDVINKPTILTLVYFDCPGLCSPLLDGVSDVIETMGMELGKDYQVVTVSFNYNDTPEKARSKKQTFLRRHSKSHARDWIYLTGDSANIYSLVNAVGFNFKRTGNDFIHPAVVTIISPRSKITRYLYGVHFVPFDVKMAIIEAQKGLARPTINQVLEFCFSYDPAGRKYTLQVTKIAGTIILFFSLSLLIYLLVKNRKKQKRIPANEIQN